MKNSQWVATFESLINYREAHELPWHAIWLGSKIPDNANPLIAVKLLREIRPERINLDVWSEEEAKIFLINNVYEPLIDRLDVHQQKKGLEGAPQSPEDLVLVNGLCNVKNKTSYQEDYQPSSAALYQQDHNYYYEAIELPDAKDMDVLFKNYLKQKHSASAKRKRDTPCEIQAPLYLPEPSRTPPMSRPSSPGSLLLMPLSSPTSFERQYLLGTTSPPASLSLLAPLHPPFSFESSPGAQSLLLNQRVTTSIYSGDEQSKSQVALPGSEFAFSKRSCALAQNHFNDSVDDTERPLKIMRLSGESPEPKSDNPVCFDASPHQQLLPPNPQANTYDYSTVASYSASQMTTPFGVEQTMHPDWINETKPPSVLIRYTGESFSSHGLFKFFPEAFDKVVDGKEYSRIDEVLDLQPSKPSLSRSSSYEFLRNSILNSPFPPEQYDFPGTPFHSRPSTPASLSFPLHSPILLEQSYPLDTPAQKLPWHAIWLRCHAPTRLNSLVAVNILRDIRRDIRQDRVNLDAKKYGGNVHGILTEMVYDPLIARLNAHGLAGAPQTQDEFLFVEALYRRKTKKMYSNSCDTTAALYQLGNLLFKPIEFENSDARDELVRKYLIQKPYSCASQFWDPTYEVPDPTHTRTNIHTAHIKTIYAR